MNIVRALYATSWLLIMPVLAFSDSTSVAAPTNPDTSDLAHLALSDTSMVAWPRESGLVARHFPGAHGFWLSNPTTPGDLSVWISREQPNSMANRFSVAREWKQVVAQRRGKSKSKDLGCVSASPLRFHCEQQIKDKRTKTHTIEKFFWNSVNDLIVVQVRARDLKKARSVASLINISFEKTAATSGGAK